MIRHKTVGDTELIYCLHDRGELVVYSLHKDTCIPLLSKMFGLKWGLLGLIVKLRAYFKCI